MQSFKLLILSAFALPAITMHATTLGFASSPTTCSTNASGLGGATSCSAGNYINQNYGDTAAVNFTYRDTVNSTSLGWWPAGYSNLPVALYGGNGDGTGQSVNTITLTPLTGDSITLTSLQLGGYSGSYPSNVVIYDLANNVLFSSLGLSIGATTATTVSPNVTSANGIVIKWFNTGYDVGLDNINYTANAPVVAATPEPSSLMLLGTGLLGLAGAARRRFLAA